MIWRIMMSQLRKGCNKPLRHVKHHTYVDDIVRCSIDRIAAQDAAEWGVKLRFRDPRVSTRKWTMFLYLGDQPRISRRWPRCWKDYGQKRQYLKHTDKSIPLIKEVTQDEYEY